MYLIAELSYSIYGNHSTQGREPSTSCEAASELSPRWGFASLGLWFR